MITREQAQLLVNQFLASKWPNSHNGPSVVWDEQTEEYPNCWVCFWVLQRYLDTRDKRYRLGGNYPIIVDKSDGTLYATGFQPVEDYVAVFNTDKSQLKRLTLS